MKKVTILLLLFIVVKISAQLEGGYRDDYIQPPTVIPPSPTISNLMSFTSFPTNNYTGIPSISIPLFGTVTKDKAFNFNLSLNYHTNGVMVKSVAGLLGTGWSLFSGGAISRTMKGIPDERKFYGVLNNGYYEYASHTTEERKQFLYDVVKGCYDGEPDSFSFNFLGHSGKMILYKDSSGLEQVYVDSESTLKINLDYDSEGRIDSFNIVDDRGYKYFFEDKEFTTVNKWSDIIEPEGRTFVRQFPPPIDFYASAWNLSKVESYTGEEILSYNYEFITEVNDSFSASENRTDKNAELYRGLKSVYKTSFLSQLLPEKTISHIRTNNSTLKVKKISITDIGEIEFENEKGRLDYLKLDDQNEHTGASLKELKIKDLHGNLIKKFNFNYEYKGVGNRLFLKEVKEYGNVSTEALIYKLEYNKANLLPATNSKDLDYWGFFNNANNSNAIPNLPELSYFNGGDRKTNERYCTTGLLKSIVHPTGGKTEYEFESNSYSYIRDQTIDDYTTDSSNNQIRKSYNKTLSSDVSQSFNGLTIDFDQVVKLNLIGIDNGDFHYKNDKNLFRVRFIPVIFGDIKGEYTLDNSRLGENIKLEDCEDCLTRTKDVSLHKGDYLIELEHLGLPRGVKPLDFSLIFSYLDVIDNEEDLEKFKIGGGVRIKKVKKYDSELANKLLLHREFTYNFKNKPEQSSGSLVARFPMHRYNIDYSFHIKIITNTVDGTIIRPGENYTFVYDVITDYNNIPSSESSLVEYQNVSIIDYNVNDVEEQIVTNTYATSINFPDERGNSFPYLPVNSNNWKRGKLLESEVYDVNNTVVKRIKYNYIFQERSKIENLVNISSTSKNCPYESLFSKCDKYDIGSSLANCSNVFDYVVNRTYNLTSGVTLLKSESETTYFNEAFSTSKNFNTQKVYDYNLSKHIYPVNITVYKAGEQRVSDPLLAGDNSDKTYLETRLFYPLDIVNPTNEVLGLINQNRMSSQVKQIRYYGKTVDRSQKKLSETYTLYKDFGSNLYLPEKIQFSKGEQVLEDKVLYHKYDNLGRPLEVSKKNGTHIAYIWGYNKTQPIAKIENATYAQVSNYVNNLQTMSNLDKNEATENSLRTQLNNLRNVSALENSQITTYTYDPLVGVTSITDPRGETIYYQYDEFNRLEFIKDAQGNLIKEHKYKYKN